MSRPPLGLSVNVTAADGTVTRWHSNASNPENRPQNLSFSTQRMQGFSGGAVSLARRIDRDYPDAALYDTIEFVGEDGSTAYEGRIGGMPRSMDLQHSIAVQASGWVNHAGERTFSMPFVDRDMSKWRGAGTLRRANLLTAGLGQVIDPVLITDQQGRRAVKTGINGRWEGGLARAEAWYDAGPGVNIGRLYALWERSVNVSSGGDANWSWHMFLSTDDTATSFQATADLQAAGPAPATLTASAARRFAALYLEYGLSPAGTHGVDHDLFWRDVAVYGDHGLPLIGTAEPFGVAASDVIEWIAGRYCPKLNTAGVQATQYAIPHLVIENQKPYDAWLAANAFHLWQLAVWEKRTLHYGPLDLSDYDWEVREDDYGTGLILQGDTTDDLANGIEVSYVNLITGQADIATPDTYAELRDASVENPANRHGLDVRTTLNLSYPVTTDAALQLGRAALAEFNQPKSPGSITLGPHVRDRAGHWQPAWKIRAGDRIAITSSTSYSDRPRVVHETSYDHDAHRVSIAVDSSFKTLSAVLDRHATALTAANLT